MLSEPQGSDSHYNDWQKVFDIGDNLCVSFGEESVQHLLFPSPKPKTESNDDLTAGLKWRRATMAAVAHRLETLLRFGEPSSQDSTYFYALCAQFEFLDLVSYYQDVYRDAFEAFLKEVGRPAKAHKKAVKAAPAPYFNKARLDAQPEPVAFPKQLDRLPRTDDTWKNCLTYVRTRCLRLSFIPLGYNSLHRPLFTFSPDTIRGFLLSPLWHSGAANFHSLIANQLSRKPAGAALSTLEDRAAKALKDMYRTTGDQLNRLVPNSDNCDLQKKLVAEYYYSDNEKTCSVGDAVTSLLGEDNANMGATTGTVSPTVLATFASLQNNESVLRIPFMKLLVAKALLDQALSKIVTEEQKKVPNPEHRLFEKVKSHWQSGRPQKPSEKELEMIQNELRESAEIQREAVVVTIGVLEKHLEVARAYWDSLRRSSNKAGEDPFVDVKLNFLNNWGNAVLAELKNHGEELLGASNFFTKLSKQEISILPVFDIAYAILKGQQYVAHRLHQVTDILKSDEVQGCPSDNYEQVRHKHEKVKELLASAEAAAADTTSGALLLQEKVKKRLLARQDSAKAELQQQCEEKATSPSLSDELEALFQEKALLEDSLERAERNMALEDLQKVVSECDPRLKVVEHGSNAMGIALKTSDLDVTLVTADGGGVATTANLFNSIETMMWAEKNSFTEIHPLREAKTPLIKTKFILREDKWIPIDLGFTNEAILRKIKITNALLDTHTLSRKLFVCLKAWAESRGLIDGSNGFLNNRTLLLMTICYLQQRDTNPASIVQPPVREDNLTSLQHLRDPSTTKWQEEAFGNRCNSIKEALHKFFKAASPDSDSTLLPPSGALVKPPKLSDNESWLSKLANTVVTMGSAGGATSRVIVSDEEHFGNTAPKREAPFVAEDELLKYPQLSPARLEDARVAADPLVAADTPGAAGDAENALADLFRGFFDFYGTVFSPALHAVSVREGCFVWAEPIRKLLSGRPPSLIVLDPVNGKHNCASCTLPENLELFFVEVSRVRALLRRQRPLSEINRSYFTNSRTAVDTSANQPDNPLPEIVSNLIMGSKFCAFIAAFYRRNVFSKNLHVYKEVNFISGGPSLNKRLCELAECISSLSECHFPTPESLLERICFYVNEKNSPKNKDSTTLKPQSKRLVVDHSATMKEALESIRSENLDIAVLYDPARKYPFVELITTSSLAGKMNQEKQGLYSRAWLDGPNFLFRPHLFDSALREIQNDPNRAEEQEQLDPRNCSIDQLLEDLGQKQDSEEEMRTHVMKLTAKVNVMSWKIARLTALCESRQGLRSLKNIFLQKRTKWKWVKKA